MVDLPSNIFCQFANCNSLFIVHHRASDILEACNNPQKRGNKKGNEASKTHGNVVEHDTPSEGMLNVITEEDVSSSGELAHASSCCGAISNGKHHKSGSFGKEQKTNEGPWKQNYNKRIMVSPVVLPCNHGYCQECISQLTDMVCQVCSRKFQVKDAKVNTFLQQICDWFGANRTFISLLLGQDITQPAPQRSPPRLSRSASSDVTRTRTFSACPPTRSNSSDSIGSMKDEDEIDEDEPLTVDHHDGTSNANFKRLDKLNINLRSSGKSEEVSTPTSSQKASRRRGFALLSSKVLPSARASPSEAPSKSPSSGRIFRRFLSVSKKDSEAAQHKEKEEDKSKSTDALVAKANGKRESTVISENLPFGLLGIGIGNHKRNHSAVHAPSEKVTPSHKTKSKSFSITLPPPPHHHALRTSNLNDPFFAIPLVAHNPPTNLAIVVSTPSNTSSAPNSPSVSNITPKNSPKTSPSLTSNKRFPHDPPPLNLNSTATLPSLVSSPIPIPSSSSSGPSRSTSEMASAATSIVAGGAGTSISLPTSSSSSSPSSPSSSPFCQSSPSLPSSHSSPSSPLLSSYPPPSTNSNSPASRNARPNSTPPLSRNGKLCSISAPIDSSLHATSNVLTALRDTPDTLSSKNSNNSKMKSKSQPGAAATNPSEVTTQHSNSDVINAFSAQFGTANPYTVPNSAYARPVKLATPTTKPPGQLGRVFYQFPLDPLARKLEFRENRRVTKTSLSKQPSFFFEAPAKLPASSDSDALRSIAMYLPTEALEMGVVLAAKDNKCNLRAPARTHPILSKKPEVPDIMVALSSSGTRKFEKRLSLPNISMLAPDTTWKPAAKVATGSKGSSLEMLRESPCSSSSSSTSPPPSRTASLSLSSSPPPLPPPIPFIHLLEPPPPRSTGKIAGMGSLFISKFKSFSISSEDLKRDIFAEEVLKWQSRRQTMADLNHLAKFLNIEVGIELLQWVAKIDNYKRYKWTTGDLSEYPGPPIQIREAWNVEYKGDIPWGKLNLEVEDKHKDVCWYDKHFFRKNHEIFLAGDESNPLFIAVETEGPLYKVLVRSESSDDRMCILDCSRKYLSKVLQMDMENIRHIKDASIRQEMATWDTREVSRNCKFGIMYCKAGQTTEEQIFSNTSGSPEYEKFLKCLGEKIPLKGWKGFTGGLDVENDFDGTHAIYTKFKHYEIMFHVATYLSHNEKDPQHLSKKKHIGNDVVGLVFMDPYAPPLDPAFMRTHFTQVYILVQPFYPESSSSENPQPCYRISVVAKDGVRPFGPPIPANMDFVPDQLLQVFLLLKLINAERAALSSPVFRERLESARRIFLASLLNSK